MHMSIAYFPGAVLGPTAKPRGPKCASSLNSEAPKMGVSQ